MCESNKIFLNVPSVWTRLNALMEEICFGSLVGSMLFTGHFESTEEDDNVDPTIHTTIHTSGGKYQTAGCIHAHGGGDYYLPPHGMSKLGMPPHQLPFYPICKLPSYPTPPPLCESEISSPLAGRPCASMVGCHSTSDVSDIMS